MQFRNVILMALAALVVCPILHAQTRAFTNDNGTVILAELVSHKGDKVRLKRADGKEFEVIPSIFSDEDEAFIKKWMAGTPATHNYNFRIVTAKKKIEGTSQNLGYKRVKNDLWSYVISITNNSQDAVSNLTVKYRVFHSNSASYDAAVFQIIEGEARLDVELAFNRTLEVTTKPVQIYGGSRYKDSLKGCLVRIVDQADNVVMDWVSPEVTMKGKDWFNTSPAKPGGNAPMTIR